MTTYNMKVTPVTTTREIKEKVAAFRTLYGTSIKMNAKGKYINTTCKDGAVFPGVDGIKITKIGKQYLSIQLSQEEGSVDLRVNMHNPNHGIHEIVLSTKE